MGSAPRLPCTCEGSMPKRLIHMANWPWSDADPVKDTRFTYFLRSGELFTTLILAGIALIFWLPGSTYKTASVYTWLRSLVPVFPGIWVIVAIGLSLTGIVALAMDSGTMRILSNMSQGLFFLLVANSARVGAPPSILLVVLAIGGCLLIVRAIVVFRNHWHRGGVRHGRGVRAFQAPD